MNLPIIGNIIDGVTGIFKKREERKMAKVTGAAKIAEANADANNTLNLTKAEWENYAVQQNSESWKDEYLTVVITSPLLLIIVGCVYQAFTGDGTLLEGAANALAELEKLKIDMGELMYTVVLAGVGLRVWKGVK